MGISRNVLIDGDQSTSLESLIEDFCSMAGTRALQQGIWREEPVALMEFFTSVDFLSVTPHPGKQTELVEVVYRILMWKFTGDPAYCPPDMQQITEIVSLFGKGAGKDFLASCFLAYVCYLLCCMNDPHRYFNFAPDENIDLVNVAINAYQANNVFFKKFKARIKNCKWFRKLGGEPVKYNDCQIMKSQIKFYRNITAHSTHSEGEAFEGFNPLFVIFDEIGGYEKEKADSCYDIFHSSAVTRYGERCLLLFISYPREEGDMIMQKYEESFTNPQVYSIRGASWEVNPTITKKSLEKDYETNPETARKLYECIPPKSFEGLFQFPEKIDTVVVHGKYAQNPGFLATSQVITRTLHNFEERHFTGLELFGLMLDPQYIYYIGGDAGVTSDSYVLSVMHGEAYQTVVTDAEGVPYETWVNKPVEDLLLMWKPNKKDRLAVDLLNVADVLEVICKQVFVKKFLSDKFNSAEVAQRLMTYGVDAEDKSFSNPFQLQIYQNLKSLIYTNGIELLDHVPMYENTMNPNEELKHLKLINGSKIDHDKDKSKDFSDARAAAAYICSMDEVASPEHFAMPSITGARRKGA